jgi:type I restriction enzyme S subunit
LTRGSLGELLPIKYGKSLPAAIRDGSGSVPVFGSSGVVGHHSTALTNGPTIIVGRKGNVGAVHYSAVPCWPIDTAYFVEPPAGHSPAYYRYLLSSLNLVRLDKSTAIPGLSRDDYNAVEVTIHAPVRQVEIVAELEKQFSRLDEAVANLQRVKANLKRYKASILKAAVEGRLVETEASLAHREGRTYETGEQLLQRILEERRGQWQKKTGYKEPSPPALADQIDLPDGWVWACVEQLNPCNRPCAYGVLQPGEDLANGVPFVRVGDINDGMVDFSGMKRIDPDIAAAYPRTYLKGGEVLLTLVGAIGRTAVVPNTLAGANVARAVGVLPINGSIDPHWVEMWFRNPAKIVEMTGKSHEVARKTLNLEDVRLAAVALPPRHEQIRVVAEVDRHLSIIREVEAEVDANLQRAQTLRQSVLSKAFAA